MKLRNGWVSNSSTSSFVLLGFDATDTPDFLDGDNVTLPSEFDYLNGIFWEDDKLIVGQFIARFTDESYLDYEEIDLSKITDEVTLLRNKYKPDAKILVYMGTEMS